MPYSTNNLLLKRCIKHPVRNDYIMYTHTNLSSYTKLCSLYKLLTQPLEHLRQSEWHQSMYSGLREVWGPSQSVRSGRNTSCSSQGMTGTVIMWRYPRSNKVGTKPQTSLLDLSVHVWWWTVHWYETFTSLEKLPRNQVTADAILSVTTLPDLTVVCWADNREATGKLVYYWQQVLDSVLFMAYLMSIVR